MRLGVLDVGSNTVHLLVVDAHPGARPWPASSHKTELRLAEHLAPDGTIDDAGAKQLKDTVRDALAFAERQRVEDLLAFATSAVRDAGNGDAVLDDIRKDTGVELDVLSGDEEARLTFLAVRRWFGWSSGRLLVADIGGGSLELASGIDEEPDVAFSLPLGAGRLARTELRHDPPKPGEVKAVRKDLRVALGRAAGPLLIPGPPNSAVGTSKTFRQLARITGAAPSSEGPYVERVLSRDALSKLLPDLLTMPVRKRQLLPGVSPTRAPQLIAGALVAEAVFDVLDISEVEICPWALREGIILRRLDWIGVV